MKYDKSLLQIDRNCLQSAYNLSFVINDIILVIINYFIVAKSVPFLLQAGLKTRNSSAGLEKRLLFKKGYFVVIRLCKAILR